MGGDYSFFSLRWRNSYESLHCMGLKSSVSKQGAPFRDLDENKNPNEQIGFLLGWSSRQVNTSALP